MKAIVSDSLQDHPLIIGVTTRAMFDLAAEHSVFEREGVQAYAALQLARENDPLKPGAAFEVTRRLLALNPEGEKPFVEVILLSRNSPDLSLRAFHAFEEHKIPIRRGSFTSGRSVAPFVKAWGIDLFLSNDEDDVRAAHAAGTAAARLGPRPEKMGEEPLDEVRFAGKLLRQRIAGSIAADAAIRAGKFGGFRKRQRREVAPLAACRT